MTCSSRQILTISSAIYLLALTILAAYALHKTHALSFPLPLTLSAFTLALPLISGLLLEIIPHFNPTQTFSRHAPRFLSRNSVSQWAVLALFIYETVLATLAGTYLSPVNGLNCGLDERWRALFASKNEEGIRTIQDILQCCGLHSTVDMAWPFPSKENGIDACVKRYERTTSCFEGWRGEERGVAGIVLGVVLAVAVWKVLVLFIQSSGGIWENREEGGFVEAPYRDEPYIENVDEEEDAGLASRVQPSPVEIGY